MNLKERLGQQIGALIIANFELAVLGDAKDVRIKELEDELAKLRLKADGVGEKKD